LDFHLMSGIPSAVDLGKMSINTLDDGKRRDVSSACSNLGSVVFALGPK
jgi:hypothetical protein